MATALGFVVLAIGLSFIYLGYKGLSVSEFWGGLLTGKLPQKGSHS